MPNITSHFHVCRRRVRRLAKDTPTSAVARQEGGLIEQRNQLRARIRGWELLLPIYVPGLLSYRTQHGPLENAEHPEDHVLWLPSKIEAESRLLICHSTLPNIEETLRTRQCFDALDNLRHALTLKSRLIAFKNKNVRGQREGTRSRAIIDRIHDKARAAVVKYREAREAKQLLSGGGEWEDVLRVLADEDIRTFHDGEAKVSSGRRGTVEDGVVEGGGEGRGEGEENGTGETRRTLSWIWLAPRQRQCSTEDDSMVKEDDSLLKVEWGKSRARANRGTEEVLLLKEEMRRALEYLGWKEKWWKDRVGERMVDDPALAEGLKSYALYQSEIQRGLRAVFKDQWEAPLTETAGQSDTPPLPPSTLATSSVNINCTKVAERGEDEDEDEGDEDDEDSEDDEHHDHDVDELPDDP
ncbi:hypothetical protein BJ165DRAFT_1347869 [Panaeolus papilionaceus]|nr:hypothetical protein BJ165DRAFT_1347869 [Panaeolus papilionaceus]